MTHKADEASSRPRCKAAKIEQDRRYPSRANALSTRKATATRRSTAASTRPASPTARINRTVLDSAVVDRERFAEHLAAPNGRGVVLSGGFDGHAGGRVCGDLIRVSVRVEGDRVVEAGFDASGCGALTAAGSAAVTLVEGELLLDAARVGTRAIADELGGLSPGKLHAADLAADALHRALGARRRAPRSCRRRGARSSR